MNIFLKDAIRKRPSSKNASDTEILLAIGNLFTRTSDEEGGRENRRENAALKRVAFEEYKKANPEKFVSKKTKKNNNDDFSDDSSVSS